MSTELERKPGTVPTAIERVEQALKMDVTVAAQQAAVDLPTFDPATMGEPEYTSLVDRGTTIATALKRLEEQRGEIHRGFEDLKKRVTGPLTKIIDELTRAKKDAADLVTSYRRVLADRKREEEDRVAKENATAAAAASEGAFAPPAAVTPTVAPANKAIGAIGTATGRRNLCVKLVDIKLAAEKAAHVLVMDAAAAKAEARAQLARARGDEKAMVAEMAKLGIEAWYDEGTSFGVRG